MSVSRELARQGRRMFMVRVGSEPACSAQPGFWVDKVVGLSLGAVANGET